MRTKTRTSLQVLFDAKVNKHEVRRSVLINRIINACAISKVTVYKWLSGEMDIKEKYRKKLAEVLGVNEIDLGTAIIKTKGQYKKRTQKVTNSSINRRVKRATKRHIDTKLAVEKAMSEALFTPNKTHVELAIKMCGMCNDEIVFIEEVRQVFISLQEDGLLKKGAVVKL
jgi:hypothetical protein